MRVRLDVLGCRLNISEVEDLARQLTAAGHQVVTSDDEPVDVCILNSCAVTHVAARKSRQLIRGLRRRYPQARIVVTGCYAQLAPEEVAGLTADLVVNNRDKERLLSLVEADLGLKVFPREATAEPAEGESTGIRTRAFVKVQDGCDNRCTYCVVRLLRGRARSRDPEEVVVEISHLVDAGYKEVVLSGVHLGCYGQELGDAFGLQQLVERILKETDIARLRLSSLEPWDIPPDFFSLWQDRRLGRHLHLPLQSGSDAVLRRMARRTTTAAYARLIASARASIPDLSATTDVMVGFPGETEAEFRDSLAFVKDMAFAKLHVFRFSPRPGTRAADMPGRVSSQVANQRSALMHQLGKEMEQSHVERFVGRTMEVLWETGQRELGTQTWHGLTENYLRVSAVSHAELHNSITSTRLISTVGRELSGEILWTGAPVGAD